MREIVSLLMTVLGCILFIQLLPTLVWLFIIIMGIAFVYSTYQRYKYLQYQKKQKEQTMYYSDADTSVNREVKPDVIDVEFSESEEDVL